MIEAAFITPSMMENRPRPSSTARTGIKGVRDCFIVAGIGNAGPFIVVIYVMGIINVDIMRETATKLACGLEQLTINGIGHVAAYLMADATFYRFITDVFDKNNQCGFQ